MLCKDIHCLSTMHDGKWRRERAEAATLKQREEKEVGDEFQNVWLWGGEFSRLKHSDHPTCAEGRRGRNMIAKRRSRYLEVFLFVGRTQRCFELTRHSAFTQAHTNILARQTPEPTHKNNWRLRLTGGSVFKMSQKYHLQFFSAMRN